MEPNYKTAITHGGTELGKDLVIVKKDKISFDVTAIVVKCGNISGKTAGEVDQLKTKVEGILTAGVEKKLQEIESQINQALEHPADVPTIFRELPVDKVIVIVAGAFSQHAKRRLIKEVPSLILENLKDIQWLVDQFTDHYPQIFFEQEVIDFIQEQISRFEGQHWLGGKRINFSDYFIDPLVAKAVDTDTPTAKAFEALAKRKKIPFTNLKQIVSRKRNVLLVGDPSSGKSGALVKLAIEMLRDASANIVAGHEEKKPIEIPILTTAKQLLTANGAESLLKDITAASDLRGRVVVNLLMVDALDEVPSETREEALAKATRFAQELKVPLLLTSRKIEPVRKVPKGFTEYELMPFQINQALKMYDKLVHGNKEKLRVLKNGLEQVQFKIPLFPLSLIFLLELVEEKKEVPASVTELYDRFSDLALGRWDKEKGVEVLFEYLIKKRFLAALSHYELHMKARVDMPRVEFDAFLEEYSKNYGWESAYLAIFLKELERTGILHLGETVMFKHRSFLDYLGAFHIYDQHDKIKDPQSLIVNTYFDDNWGDTTFFVVGLKREVSDGLIEKILNYPQNDLVGQLNKLAIGKLLQAGWHSPVETKRKALRQGISFIPVVRDEFSKIEEIPALFRDVIIIGVAETCYRSSFLYKDLVDILKGHLKDFHPDSLFTMLAILAAIKELMTKSEQKELFKKYTELLTEHGETIEQARVMPFLMVLQKDDQAVYRKLRKRSIALLRSHPDIITKLKN